MPQIKFSVDPITNKGAVPILDPTTFCQVTEDTFEYRLHTGQSFYSLISTIDLDTAPLHLNWTVPALSPEQLKKVHMSVFFSAVDAVNIIFAEDVTGQGAGTSIVPISRNRSSAKTSVIASTLNEGGTLPTGAGQYLYDLDLGSVGGGSIGADVNIQARYILKPGAIYSLAMTGPGNKNICHLGMGWTEQIDYEVEIV